MTWEHNMKTNVTYTWSIHRTVYSFELQGTWFWRNYMLSTKTWKSSKKCKPKNTVRVFPDIRIIILPYKWALSFPLFIKDRVRLLGKNIWVSIHSGMWLLCVCRLNNGCSTTLPSSPLVTQTYTDHTSTALLPDEYDRPAQHLSFSLCEELSSSI